MSQLNKITSNRFFNKTSKGSSLKKLPLSSIDYKNYTVLTVATSTNGRILPRRILGIDAKRHRILTRAIKIARYLAIMPF
ncbi:MAG: 30S ribosomal protein S18 [Rickettsiales bacterium]